MQQETYKVQEAQTIFDISLSTCGNIEDAIDLLVLNNLNFDSVLPASITYDVQNNSIVKSLYGVDITTGSNLLSVSASTLVYTNTGNGDSEQVVMVPVTKKKYLMQEHQSIFDVACMVSGKMEDVIDIMVQNALSFDASVQAGTMIQYEGEMFITDDITTSDGSITATTTGAFSDGFSTGFD